MADAKTFQLIDKCVQVTSSDCGYPLDRGKVYLGELWMITPYGEPWRQSKFKSNGLQGHTFSRALLIQPQKSCRQILLHRAGRTVASDLAGFKCVEPLFLHQYTAEKVSILARFVGSKSRVCWTSEVEEIDSLLASLKESLSWIQDLSIMTRLQEGNN